MDLFALFPDEEEEQLLVIPGDTAEALIENFSQLLLTNQDKNALFVSIQNHPNQFISRGVVDVFLNKIHRLYDRDRITVLPALFCGQDTTRSLAQNVFDRVTIASRLIILPVFDGSHWLLAIVFFNARRVYFVDSLLPQELIHPIPETFIRNSQLLFVIAAAWSIVKGERCSSSEWEFAIVEDTRQQTDNQDSAVYVCEFAEFLFKFVINPNQQLPLVIGNTERDKIIATAMDKDPVTSYPNRVYCDKMDILTTGLAQIYSIRQFAFVIGVDFAQFVQQVNTN